MVPIYEICLVKTLTNCTVLGILPFLLHLVCLDSGIFQGGGGGHMLTSKDKGASPRRMVF